MAKIEKEYAVLVHYPYDEHVDEIHPMPSKKKARKYASRNQGYWTRCSIVSRPVPQDWKVIEPSTYRE